MDENVLQMMLAHHYPSAPQDPHSLEILSGRVEEHGSQGDLITYSQLVENVQFHIPTINRGNAYLIDIHNWTYQDRELVGEFCGLISTNSYQNHGFMASALVVNQDTQRPASTFFEWMRYLGLIPNLQEQTKEEFWVAQVNLAFAHFQHH
jgi:hypothetical protein